MIYESTPSRRPHNGTVLCRRLAGTNVKTISPSALAERLGTDDEPFVLDIRPEREHRRNAIDGSDNLPVYVDIQRGNDESLLDHLDAIPTNAEVIVVCKMGIVAKRAAKLLDGEGYDATVLLGGMSGWTGYRNGSIGYKLRSLLWKFR